MPLEMDVHDPLHNLREACKQALLLEDHLFHRPKHCDDCVSKHLLTMEALIEEAVTLDESGRLRKLLERLLTSVLIYQMLWRSGSLPAPDLAQVIRRWRKGLAVRLLAPRLVRKAALRLVRKAVLRWKRVRPGLYEAKASIAINGKAVRGTFTVDRVSDDADYGQRAAWTWMANLDSGTELDGGDVFSSRKEALAAVEDALRRGFKYTRWGLALE